MARETGDREAILPPYWARLVREGGRWKLHWRDCLGVKRKRLCERLGATNPQSRARLLRDKLDELLQETAHRHRTAKANIAKMPLFLDDEAVWLAALAEDARTDADAERES